MRLTGLWLADFRAYRQASLAPAPDGLTVVVGANGSGKTSLLEAIGYLATLSSFRGVPSETLIRHGCERAVVRAEGDREGRALLLEAELTRMGRGRVLLNRQPLRRSRDLLGALRVSVFSPDDLALVKGAPADRRRYLDDALVALRPADDALRGDVERILRQRAALLKQFGGRRTLEIESTLDVWDAKLTDAGTALVEAREALVRRLEPEVQKAYAHVAAAAADVGVTYQRSWVGPLDVALAAAREADLRRGATSVGPHRDELVLSIDGMPARTHASQGEQRSLALALRLAAHDVVTEATNTSPVLLLDDVFSELDPDRGEALLAHLPAGQALLTTAGALPRGARPALVLRVREGTVGP